MMAAQKVKTYLEKHKIGALFEDLMAKVIKEMPSEPLSFLIELLQKMYDKKHPKKASSAVQSLQSLNFSLAGIPAPQRSQREPQVVLPGGGKTISNTWSSHDIDQYRSNRVSFEENTKRREYDKPWQSGLRYSKLKDDHELRQSLRNSMNKEMNRDKPLWNGDTKVPSHDFDEWMKHEERYAEMQMAKREKKPYYMGVKSWADTTAAVDMGKSGYEGGGILRQPVASRREVYESSDDLDFSRPIRSRKVNFEGIPTSDSESSFSTFAMNTKAKAKDRADERKKKLQNLLIGDLASDTEKYSSAFQRDSSDEAEEIYESAEELEYEGARHVKYQNHLRTKRHPFGKCSEDDIKVKICGRCARFMTGEQASTIVGTFKSDAESKVWDRVKSTPDITHSVITEDYDFESVSQIGKNGKNTPAWPILYDTEEKATPRSSVEKISRGTMSLGARGKSRNGSHLSSRSADEASVKSRDRLDHEVLFSGDPRLYQKQRAKKAGYLTDTETEIGKRSVVSASSAFRPRSGRGWAVRSLGTDSEADAEDSDPALGLRLKKSSRGIKHFIE